MKKRVPKSECTRKIEWDRSVLKILTFWSRSKVHLVKAFSLYFFFFFLVGGSDRVRFSGWSNRLVGDDIISDVIVLEGMCGTCKRVSGWGGSWNWGFERRWLRRCMKARGWFFGLEFFGLCQSNAVEDHGIVSFLKPWADLHKFEGLCRGPSLVCGGTWGHVPELLDLKFLGFVDRSPFKVLVGSVFVKWGLDFHKSERKSRGFLLDYGLLV